MKTLHALSILLFFFPAIIFNGCSPYEAVQEKKIEFLGKSVLNDNTTLYKYKFNFNGNAWMDVSVYVKKENMDYIITINDTASAKLNTYTYKPYLDEQNLLITNRVRKENAESLEDAIEKSIFFYLSDSI